MAARRTIRVSELVDVVNDRLARDDLYLKAPGKDRDMTPDEAYRMGIASLLEHFLFETDNYHGYGFQPGQVSGWKPDEETIVKDETRRVYSRPRWAK